MFVTEKLISLIAPHLCISCGSEGAVVCGYCLPDFVLRLPERCYRCKAQTDNSLVCKNCRHYSRLKHVWLRTEYQGPFKQLVRSFKFSRVQAAAELLARLLADCLPYVPPDMIVAHVPTAPNRVRQRGYDHAELLAKSLARERGLLYSDALMRSGKTRQVGASREQRLSQLDGAFRVARPKRIQGASILLVDDIVTTGGTLQAAARCLKNAGAKQVDAAVFAQKE